MNRDAEIRRLEKIMDEEGDTLRARRAAARFEEIMEEEAEAMRRLFPDD